MNLIRFDEIEYVEFDESQYLQTGIKGIDQAIVGFGLGQLVIITGTRGGGKTTLIGQILCNFIEQGYSGILCSFEMTNSRLQNWIIRQLLGKDNLIEKQATEGKIYYQPKNKKQEEQVKNWVGDKLKVYTNSSFKRRDISDTIKGEIDHNPKIKFVVLDNLMKIDFSDYKTDKYETQSKVVKNLQQYAQKHNICLILVAHPNKVKTLPRIEDVAGSSDIINVADTVLLVHRVTEDFKIRAKEYFEWKDGAKELQYSNIIEIAKDREFGVVDTMGGVYFEPIANRFLNKRDENIHYGWELVEQQEIPF